MTMMLVVTFSAVYSGGDGWSKKKV